MTEADASPQRLPDADRHFPLLCRAYATFCGPRAARALEDRQGERVWVRLINAGYQTQYLDLHGHRFRVTYTDGQPLTKPKELRDELVAVAPGERYDLEFVADNPGAWWLEAHAPAEEPAVRDMRALIHYADARTDGDSMPSGGESLVFDRRGRRPTRTCGRARSLMSDDHVPGRLLKPLDGLAQVSY